MIDCWRHPESEKLYCEKVDFGDGEVRQIASGLQKLAPIEEMKGPCVALVNLKPAKMAGFESNGMILGAMKGDKVELLRPPAGAKPGERIQLAGTDPLPQER